MSEPSRPRPVPAGPAVPAAPAGAEGPRDGVGDSAATEAATAAATGSSAEPAATVRLEGLDERPVAEHVDVFEAEHARLERELRTIDQL